MRVALALGMTLQKLYSELSYDELNLWKAYELTQGLPQTRLEASIAMSGAATCQCWGAKVKPIDLIPRFEEPKRLSYKDGAAIFKAMANRHNQNTRS